MANVVPLERDILQCLDWVIAGQGLASPILDVGRGAGDVGAHIARRGVC